jgi:hypothetical protein
MFIFHPLLAISIKMYIDDNLQRKPKSAISKNNVLNTVVVLYRVEDEPCHW